MTFENQKFDLTDKELDFAKSNPELFSKYLDYCNNSLDIKKQMINAHLKELDIHLKELDINASRTASNKQFWEDLATIGVVGLGTLSNKE